MKAKTQVLTSRFQLALLHATVLHAKDVRKGTSIPYVEHLLGVASLVLADGGSEDEVVGALLHDALEDHAGPRRQLLFPISDNYTSPSG